MGSSPSINDLAEKEQAFDAWLKSAEDQLKAKAAALLAVQNQSITDFYSENNWSDAVSVTSGSDTSFQHQADFTLKNLKAAIDAVGAALFSNSSVPDGTSVDQAAAKSAVKAAQDMGVEAADEANIELYVASKVFDVLSSVIMSFGTQTKLSYSHTFKSEPLGFGMQFFCTVVGSSIQSTSYFNNETIFQYLYLFEARFSLSQAKSEGVQDLVRQYENAIAAFETRLNALDDEVAAGKLTGEQYTDQSKIWTDLINKNEAQLTKMKAKAYRQYKLNPLPLLQPTPKPQEYATPTRRRRA
jgi:hypothetical protein